MLRKSILENQKIIDLLEDKLLSESPELLVTLLKDHTTSRANNCTCNIFWATNDYEHLGEGFTYSDPITTEHITGEYGYIIQPRICKDKETQILRSKNKAEVFTPSWICNNQNNLIDNAWFGREGVFNSENDDNSWTANNAPITFPEGKTWKDYVRDIRLEITCGEAPYLASRYDTVTGEFIPVEQRIGMLDRKLRVINENCHKSGEWLNAARKAYQSVYGFEWQGDSLLIARETLLYTFVENYRLKFGKNPLKKSLKSIADIISWNLWQMDGLKGVVPNSCTTQKDTKKNIFGEEFIEEKPCNGCLKGNIHEHNGIKCLIRDWRKSPKEKQIETFISSIKF